MEMTGIITHVLDKKSGTGKNGQWFSQSYVLETQEQYPKHLCFEVFGDDKITKFNIKHGQTLTVSFDIDAREYQGKWYNSIRAWNVQPAATQVAPAAVAPQPVADFSDNSGQGKLPF